jgi:hypothetical protein
MTSRSTRDIERALLRKGFIREDTHHRFLILLGPSGDEAARTRLSHGIREYGDDLLAKVADQLRLSKRELLDPIDCRMSGEQYVALLSERGAL